jgi:hypothetical protein
METLSSNGHLESKWNFLKTVHLVLHVLAHDVHGFVSHWVVVHGAGVDQVVKILDVPNFSLVVQEKLIIKDHVKEPKDAQTNHQVDH